MTKAELKKLEKAEREAEDACEKARAVVAKAWAESDRAIEDWIAALDALTAAKTNTKRASKARRK